MERYECIGLDVSTDFYTVRDSKRETFDVLLNMTWAPGVDASHFTIAMWPDALDPVIEDHDRAIVASIFKFHEHQASAN